MHIHLAKHVSSPPMQIQVAKDGADLLARERLAFPQSYPLRLGPGRHNGLTDARRIKAVEADMGRLVSE